MLVRSSNFRPYILSRNAAAFLLTLVICRVNHIVNVISIRHLIDLATDFLGLKESRRVFLSQGQLHHWGCVSHEPV